MECSRQVRPSLPKQNHSIMMVGITIYILYYDNFYPIPNVTKLDLSFLSDIG